MIFLEERKAAFLRVDCQMQGVQKNLLACLKVWRKSGYRSTQMEKPSTLGLAGKKKTEDFIRSIISPVRQRAGLGCPPDKFTTNQSERTNGVLQDCVKRECGTAKINEYTLVKTLEKLVKSQEQELELAVLDKGEYQLRPEFRHLVVTGDKWATMTNDQREEALSCVHRIGLEKASPNSVASVNKKLVEGESAVFQQILSAGVDWITQTL